MKTINDQSCRRLATLAALDAGRVKIALADNGIGSPAESLTRIFKPGFTTKAAGHGFGLHRGAPAAREPGGSLKLQSDGPGPGAVFTLDLPYQPEKTS